MFRVSEFHNSQFAFRVPRGEFFNRESLSLGSQYHQRLLDFICRYLASRGFWTKRSVYHEGRWQRLGYVIPILVGGYLVFKGHRLSDPLNLRVIPHVDALAWIGVVLCIAGLAFCIWARFTLGRNWSGVVTLKGGHELITRGPYSLVRHPIYTGLLTMFIATVIVLGHVAGIIALPLVFVSIWIKLRYEEKLMLQKFPDQYAVYQRRVKPLIPFIL